MSDIDYTCMGHPFGDGYSPKHLPSNVEIYRDEAGLWFFNDPFLGCPACAIIRLVREKKKEEIQS